jgi:predicted secreted Zn-dependent protease
VARPSRGSLLLAFVVLSSLACPARAELKYATTYRDYLVHGTTPQMVWQYMAAHPIMDPDDGPALANITHDHKLAVSTATIGGTCKVTSLAFSWDFVITLPKAVDEKKMTPATDSLWREFVAKCRWHEEHRQEIFLGCGKTFTAAAEAMTGPAGCLDLDRRVRSYIDQQYTACMKTQRDFGRQDAPRISSLRLIRAGKGLQ